MFKQLFDGWKAKRIIVAMGQANAYVARNDWPNAKKWLGVADHFSRTATIHRRLLIDLITAWGFVAIALKEQGRLVAAEECAQVSKLLQAKFDAGDFYADAPGATGFFDS